MLSAMWLFLMCCHGLLQRPTSRGGGDDPSVAGTVQAPTSANQARVKASAGRNVSIASSLAATSSGGGLLYG